MKCLHPVVINIDAYGESFKHIPVPCGKCEVCLHNRARDWQIRLYEEMKHSTTACFVTLTYDESTVPYQHVYDPDTGEYICDIPTVRGRDLQLFLKRIRKRFPGTKVRYFGVSEYGPDTFRPHYHVIVFNVPKECCNNKFFHSVWKNGFTTTKRVTPGRISYVTKYCFGGLYIPEGYTSNIMRCSTKPAIGYQFLERFFVQLAKESLESCYYFKQGYKLPVPKYYLRKAKEMLLTEEDKLQRLRDYVYEGQWLDWGAIFESLERQKALSEGKDWYETNSEASLRRFKRDFHKKYNKNRKL